MDDEPALRKLFSRLLVRMGYEVVVVPDGEQALDVWRAAREAGHPFDLVILDLMVAGGMGGKEALALLRREDPQLLGVVSSGYSHDPVLAAPADYGFAGRLVKPFSGRQVADEVARVLNLRSSPA
jgi:CheY-like chemotaxis protein